ncbi:MAG: hypothetical protein QGI68_01020 [Pseudomonadales bacterium]|jgi:hypothetical protein|nr:hypothetical protein [Pseudomonadales bacterium]MDP7594138.1 hypothetical protein [Pseudomonadales bacterium]HJN49443.1 hypothetical protein [Pseudomonadales bacterium]|tara:strand:+ start:1925 stop:2641 length:717 start_codon:yes stop_codon:yes gene_type:complete
MGILVQREFSVSADHRTEFERQSRLGVWENMLYNGAQMIAFGSWAFGGPGDVVVTHSVYKDFDHWTATRGWGAFATDSKKVEETAQIRAIFAGRQRLIEKSRATIIDYDDQLSEPAPFYRRDDDPIAPLPPTYGRQSIVAETRYRLRSGTEDEFLRISSEVLWPWLQGEDARLLIYGRDPLTSIDEVVVMTAYRDISAWHRLSVPDDSIESDFAARQELIADETTRLLMVTTRFGNVI